MFRRIVICLTLICFIVCVQGCTSKYRLRRNDIQPELEYSFMTVVTIDDEVFKFNDGAHLVGNHIEGYLQDSSFVRIPLEDVELAYIVGFDATKTMWYTAGFVSVGVSLAILIPFIILGPQWP